MTAYTIDVLVKNQPGVLASVSELFGRWGYNIDKLSVGKYKKPTIARMKISTYIDDSRLEKVIDQLKNLIEVIQVKSVSPNPIITQDMIWNFRDILVGTLTPVKQKIQENQLLSYWLVAYSLFITLLGTNLPAPLYALYRTQWNLSSGVITLIFAAYAFVVIPTIIISGQLSDRIGRKKVLIPGVLFSLLGSVSFALADRVGMLLLSRLFQGLSVGMLNAVAVAAMTELDEKQDRMKAAFIGAIMVTVGNALGPVLSGILGEYAPFPTKLSYVVHILFVLPGILGLFYLNEKMKTSSGSIHLHRPHVPKDIRKGFFLSSMTSFIAWGIMSLMMSIIPSYLDIFIGKSNLIISGAVIALVLCFSTLNQLLLKKLPIPTMITIGYSFLGLGLIGMVLTLLTQSLFALLLTTVLIGLGHGPTYAGSLALVNEVSPDSSRADIISSFYVFTYIGVSIPILSLGYGAQWIGLTNAVEIFAGLMGGIILVSWVFWRRSWTILRTKKM